jgi:photosystem II stability/assembly factor-like uncharacterized protein
LLSFFNTNEGVVIGDPITRGAAFEIYTTANGGANWTAVAGTPTSAATGEFGSISYFGTPVLASVVGTHIWFATDDGRVFHSANKGQTWTVADTKLAGPISGLAFRDEMNGLAVLSSDTDLSHQLARTTDGGATWTPVTYQGPLHGYGISRVPGTSNYLSVGADIGNGDTGSSYSRDNGQTWIDLESTINHLEVEAVSSTVAWTGALASGIYKLNSAVLGTRQDVALQKAMRVYPNPSADGQFTVQLGSNLGSEAQVSVFDALGRSVHTQTVKAAANPVVAVDLAQQAAGIYTLRVSSESGAAQQKLVIK